jgi:hypothetical protein
MNDNFEILNKFKGFGNPTGDFWFIGIEEALPTTTENLQETLKNYKTEILSTKTGEIKETAEKLGNKFTKVYDIMSKIIKGDNWKEYRDNRLLQADSNEFQMNLFPLGKPRVSNWPTHYNELFSIPSIDIYIDHVKTTRFKMLKGYWDKYKPRVTICFGSSFLNEFKLLFNLSDSEEILFKEEKIYFYPQERVLITPFFDYRQLKSKGLMKIIEIIKDLRK